MTITEFLLAMIAEDEAWATARMRMERGADGSLIRMADTAVGFRLRKECEAKRRIIGAYQALALRKHADEVGSIQWHEADAYRVVLTTLASVYANHPDYDRAWAVD